MMAKRFTDTDKWKKPFIRSLKAPYKLLWLYIIDECSHAGIWQVEMDIAQIKIGEQLSVDEALQHFKDKVIVFSEGEKWFIPDFIEFQYGVLNPENRAHNSVIQILEKYKLFDKNKGLVSPIQGAKDKDKEMDKVKVKEKGGISKEKQGQDIDEEFKYTLLDDKGYYHTIGMAWGVNTVQFEKMVDGYEANLAAQSKVHPNYGEYKKHFHNWGAKCYPDYKAAPTVKTVNGIVRKSANEFI